MSAVDRAALVKAKAAALGFDLCGIAVAGPLDPAPFEKWLESGWSAGLHYMKDRVAERMDPRLLVPNARSVIVVACSYGSGAGGSSPRGTVPQSEIADRSAEPG